MKIKIFSLAAFLVLLSSVTFAQSKDEQTLDLLLKQMTDAQTAYDAAALDKLFTSDFIEMSPVGEFDPRAKAISFYSPEAKLSSSNAKMSTTVEMTERSVRIYDKFAIVIVKLNFSISMDGKPLPPRSMRLTAVCRKEKGGWKIASTQYTGIRTSPTASAKPQ
jgi:ketosteroid isomerase-like protein